MIKAIHGSYEQIEIEYDGTYVSHVAPTLLINDQISAISVSVVTDVAGQLSLSHTLLGIEVGAVLKYYGGTITTSNGTYPLVITPRVVDVLIGNSEPWTQITNINSQVNAAETTMGQILLSVEQRLATDDPRLPATGVIASQADLTPISQSVVSLSAAFDAYAVLSLQSLAALQNGVNVITWLGGVPLELTAGGKLQSEATTTQSVVVLLTQGAAPSADAVVGGLSLEEVLAIINSPAGELVTFTPAVGLPRQIRAIVARELPATSGDMSLNRVRIFLARHPDEGVAALVKGSDTFTIQSQPHLPAREFVVGDIESGENWFNAVLV